MFLYEKDLQEAFWEKYKGRPNILSYQFDSGRRGGMDIVTFETLGERYEFNAFECKLNDIKKGILQCRHNLMYCHKAWLVMPEEKKKVIKDKYAGEIIKTKGLGVILVKETGYYEMFIKTMPKPEAELVLNQELLRLACFGERK